MDMSAVIDQMIILFFVLAVGYLAGRTGIMTPEFTRGLSRLVLTVTMPALLISSVLDSPRTQSVGQVLLLLAIACGVYLFLIGAGFLMPIILRVPRQQTGVYRFMTIFGNVGFMGFPVIEAVAGQEGLVYATLYQLPFNLLVYSLGIRLIAGKETRLSAKQMLLNPGVIAAVVALLLYLIQPPLPTFVSGTVSLLGRITTPAAMLIIGATLSTMPAKRIFMQGRLYPFCLLSNLLLPLLLWFILRTFVSDSLMLQVSVVLAGMPVATNATMLCHQYHGDAETASAGAFLSTALSLVTVPLLVWLMSILPAA